MRALDELTDSKNWTTETIYGPYGRYTEYKWCGSVLPDTEEAAVELETLRAESTHRLSVASEQAMEINRLNGLVARYAEALRRIMKATPHSMCSDAEAWAIGEELTKE